MSTLLHHVDVWGLLPKPEGEEQIAGMWRLIKTSLNHFTPLAPLRFAGPLGMNSNIILLAWILSLIRIILVQRAKYCTEAQARHA